MAVSGGVSGWLIKKLMQSPPTKSRGAPSNCREIERAFWVEIARGLSSESAATTVGVSLMVGARRFRHRDVMSLFVHAR